MASRQDTEITLGAGKILALFFGLVVLCGVFFGMGFSMGRSSVKPITSADLTSPALSASAGARTAAVKPAASTGSADLSFYKTVEQKSADTAPDSSTAAAKQPDNPAAPPADAAAANPTPPAIVNGYYVQVAAVTRQEDAAALVEALKSKQYPAFTSNTTASDKLFHVQLGPYAELKDAEAMRVKLVSDGYNPIVKK